MKAKNYLLFLLIPTFTTGFAQNYTQNYIIETIVKDPGKTTISELQSLSEEHINRTITYLDGLGRPKQTVQWHASPAGNDVVQPFEYDMFGREDKKYLPYSSSVKDGTYKTDALLPGYGLRNFYSTTPPAGVPVNTAPFGKTIFEASPLNRVIEQGAPGEVWQPAETRSNNSGRTILTSYALNAENEAGRWGVSGNSCTFYGNYAPGDLFKTTTKDENWTSSNDLAGVVEEFKDKEGRVVLKRTHNRLPGNGIETLSTYYIYDDFGNLSFVLPPGANADAGTIDQSILDNLCYQYVYDSRKRLIEKKIPGRGWEYMVYNKLDQLVLSQDANQNTANTWSFNKYDGLGRLIITGILSSATNRSNWQADIDNFMGDLWEIRDNTNSSATGTGYSNNALPNSGIGQYYTINYYDDYDFYGNVFAGAQSGFSTKTRGLLTGAKTNILGSSTMLQSINLFDEDGRVIRTQSQNHLQGIDLVDNTYNFGGQLISSNRTHSSSSSNVSIANQYTYDHAGRKLTTQEKINNSANWITISSLEYNEIGQLIKKSLHAVEAVSADITLDGNDIVEAGAEKHVVASNSIVLLPGFTAKAGSTFSASIQNSPLPTNNFLQTIEFTYNERGWLRTAGSSKLQLDLRYNEPQAGITPQFNGNISQEFYTGQYTGSKSFQYAYDHLNRLSGAVSTGGVLDESLAYDKMGNITSLTRGGNVPLSYTYSNNGKSNQLISVSGYQARSYQYDANGNATTDGVNKAIEYNLLNLPSVIKQNGNTVASYTYTAGGEKINNTGSDGIRDYVNGIVYKNGQIDFIVTEEGKAVKNGATYSYVYDLKDHLGNVRVSVDADVNGNARVVQEDEYYSFGLQKPVYNYSNNNKYLYNGKELQDDLGQYDYGARFYDPVIGRWNVPDPLSEIYDDLSPYNYAFNNPVRFVDPDGMGVADSVKKQEPKPILLKEVTVTGKSLAKAAGVIMLGTAARTGTAWGLTAGDPEPFTKAVLGIATLAYSAYVIGNEIYKYNKAVVNSQKTVDDIKKDGTPEKQTGNGTDIYNKEGGMQQADKDFNDIVVPGSARPIANGRVGKTADGKTVNVRNKSSDGRPTLEVYNPNTRQPEIKIRYK